MTFVSFDDDEDYDDFINQNQRSTIYMFQSKKQNTTKQNKTQSVDDDQSRNHFIPLLSINIIIFFVFLKIKFFLLL